MLYRLLVVLASLTLLQACSIKQTVDQVNLSQDSNLCVMENTDVREGFLQELKSSLEANRVDYRVIADGQAPEACEWTMTYTANWRWDMALYLAYADIKVFKNGSLQGRALYDSTTGGLNMSKFIDAEEKIRELVNELISLELAAIFSRSYG